MVIAIDGPAGGGKSTIAKMIAGSSIAKSSIAGAGSSIGKNKFCYVNSGNLYRAITFACINAGINMQDGAKVLETAHKIELDYDGENVVLNGKNVSENLHSDEVDKHVATVSSNPDLRHFVNDIIKKMSLKMDIVVEGRDMTSVVFPQADFRFYLDANIESRAKRRYKQNVSSLSLEEIKKTIEERDTLDKNKIEGSLKISSGVEYIDTSYLTLSQTYHKIKSRLQLKGMTMSQMEEEKSDSAEKTKNSGFLQTQMQEEYLKSLDSLEEGCLVTGKVIQVTNDQVFLDVGYKSEGKIHLNEFKDIPKVGDELTVVLEKKENKYGEVVVSKQKADALVYRKELKKAFAEHLPMRCTITKLVKGGYEASLGGDLSAFLPISQTDVHRVEAPEKYVGMEVEAYVERLYADGKLNVVINRRKFLEEDVDNKRKVFFETVPVGSEMDGVVKSFTSFGAFVDLGGFDGLLHVNDMSWGHVIRPKDFVKKGQKIKVKLIRIDPAEKRINISLKHFTDDPWLNFQDKYHVNDIVKGRVTKLTDFGAFIEIEEGIEGLAHISEFSWVKKVHNPGDVVKIGDEVECMVLGYDLQKGKVSLGLKQVTANPWLEIESKYPVGTRLKRKVVKLTNAGAFIELEDGIDGFLHSDDLSWTKRGKSAQLELNEVKLDEEIEVIILSVDGKSRNVRVGVKQLSEDPYANFAASYPLGSNVEGEISSITDFGVFLKVPGGIEGLIHKSNLVKNKEDNADEELKKYKVGDKLTACLIEVQSDKQKLAFSLRDYEHKMQKDEISRYMASSDEKNDSGFTLGDMLKSKESS
ncbi:MAG: 30S ribosomal protein S1 [Termitinemataceae bacterium]|nr:MAG: 30S ribosomal protein S1 [Termitinemataceae bacterium]